MKVRLNYSNAAGRSAPIRVFARHWNVSLKRCFADDNARDVTEGYYLRCFMGLRMRVGRVVLRGKIRHEIVLHVISHSAWSTCKHVKFETSCVDVLSSFISVYKVYVCMNPALRNTQFQLNSIISQRFSITRNCSNVKTRTLSLSQNIM